MNVTNVDKTGYQWFQELLLANLVIIVILIRMFIMVFVVIVVAFKMILKSWNLNWLKQNLKSALNFLQAERVHIVAKC